MQHTENLPFPHRSAGNPQKQVRRGRGGRVGEGRREAKKVGRTCEGGRQGTRGRGEVSVRTHEKEPTGVGSGEIDAEVPSNPLSKGGATTEGDEKAEGGEGPRTGAGMRMLMHRRWALTFPRKDWHGSC